MLNFHSNPQWKRTPKWCMISWTNLDSSSFRQALERSPDGGSRTRSRRRNRMRILSELRERSQRRANLRRRVWFVSTISPWKKRTSCSAVPTSCTRSVSRSWSKRSARSVEKSTSEVTASLANHSGWFDNKTFSSLIFVHRAPRSRISGHRAVVQIDFQRPFWRFV